MRDVEDNDITPEMDLEVGQEVDFSFLLRGISYGFVLKDEHGLVAAYDQGGSNGVLASSETPGLSVRKGKKVAVAYGCDNKRAYAIDFHGDGEVSARPVSSVEVLIDGQTYTGIALSAYDFAGGRKGCEVMDRGSGTKSWVIARD